MKNAVCLNSNTYHGFTLEEAVAGARAAGIGYIEIAAVRGYTEHARHEMTDDEVAGIQELLAENQIEAIGMCGHTNILTDEGRADFVKNLDLAQRLAVQYVVTSTGETHDDDTVIEDDSELVGILKDLAAEAGNRGLKLNIETHGNNYGSGAKIKSLLEKVGADNLGITYDTANAIFYGDVVPHEDLAASVEKVVSLHLKDKDGERTEWNFPAVGTGYIDFDKTLQALADAGNDAPLSIEIEFTSAGPASLEEVHEALVTSADNTRQLLSNH